MPQAMASARDACVAPYPSVHSAHACAVAMHRLLQVLADRV